MTVDQQWRAGCRYAIVGVGGVRVKVRLWPDEAALLAQIVAAIDDEVLLTLEACGARTEADLEVVRASA